MPTPTYTLIDSVTLGSSASSVTFSSIDQSYGDLVLVMDLLGDANISIYQRLNNNSTASAYSYVYMTGTGSASSLSQSLSFFLIGNGAFVRSTSRWLGIEQFLDYSATDKHKSVLGRYNNTSDGTDAMAGRWANTAAITQIESYTSNGNFVAGSTFHLYGIEA